MGVPQSTTFVAADGYSHPSDPTSGIYRKSATVETISIGGVDYDFSTTGATLPGTTNAGTIAASGAVTGASYSGGTVSGTTITGSVSVSAPTVTGSTSVVSGVGFKAIVGPAMYWTTSYPGGAQQMQVTVNQTATATSNTARFQWCAPFAGSVKGVSIVNNNTVATTTDLVVQKNGATLVTATAIVASGGTSGFVTYAKGANAFAAGDILQITVGFGLGGISLSTTAFIVVEMAA